MASKSRINPFYPVLVLAGMAFAITACGFALMMVRGINSSGELDPETATGFIPFLQEYGFTALMIELGVLALATVAAIATDEMWSDRVDQPQHRPAAETPATDLKEPQDQADGDA